MIPTIITEQPGIFEENNNMTNQFQTPPSPPSSSFNNLLEQSTFNEYNGILRFSNGQIRYIDGAFLNKYKKLNQPIIHRSCATFDKYIMPLLIKTNVHLTTHDFRNELGTILNDIYYYGIILDTDQIYELSEKSGLVTLMGIMNKYRIKKEKSCFSGNFKKKLKNFEKLWDKYINLVSIKHNNDDFKELTFELLYDSMTAGQFPTLLTLNVKYANMIYEFFYWMKRIIKENDDTTFIAFQVNLAKDINKNQLNTPEDMCLSITNILNLSKTKNINKNDLKRQIHNLTILNKLNS